MAIFAKHDQRFEGLEPRTGVFVALATLIVLATIVASLVRHDAFTPTMRVFLLAQSGQGIHKGMAVQLSGFKIGTVGELDLEPDARVKVTLVLQSKYASLIPQNSEVRLSKEGFIGASFIEIEPGSTQAPPIAENNVLKFYRAGDFADMAQELKERIEPILAEVKKIAESVNDPGGDIRQALRNVRQASAQVAELAQQVNRLAKKSEGKVDAVAGRVERVMDHAAATLERAHGALETVAHTLSAVDSELPALLLRFDQSLKNVEAVTSDARRLSSSLSEELPPTIRETRGLIEDAQEIVDGAKKAWPIRNLVPAPGEKALPLDSYDGGSGR